MSRPVSVASCQVHKPFALLVALLASVGLLFASPAVVAQDKNAADEAADEKEKSEPDAEDPDEKAEEAAPGASSQSGSASTEPNSDQEARSQPIDPSLEEAPGPAGWPAGKPPGPGPDGEDGETADAAGKQPDDGIGVGCQDYIDCVCTIAELSKGKTIGGYDHAATCKLAKTYTTPQYEEECANELNEVKDTLEDAKEDYKAHGVKLPVACQ